MRFSSEFNLPPAVEELLETGGQEALQALLASVGGSGGGRAHRPARFASSARASADAAGGDGSGESSASGSDSSGWWTDEESGSDGAPDAPAVRCACFIRRAWLTDVYQQAY
jgi:hypothetical protein